MMDPQQNITAPRPLDILCGRGRASHIHSGNVFFRSVVTCHLPKYSSDTPKNEKSEIVISVIQECFRQGCRFIKKDPEIGGWKELSLPEVKLKVGHALRDACADMTKSLEPLANPNSQSVLPEESISQMKLLEPRKLGPDECDRIRIAKSKFKTRNRRRGRQQSDKKLSALSTSDEPPGAASVIPAERESQEKFDLEQALSANPEHPTNLTAAAIIQQQQAFTGAETRQSPLPAQDAKTSPASSEQQQEQVPFSQILEAASRMSPETQRQIQLLHANGTTISSLLGMLADAQEIADGSALV